MALTHYTNVDKDGKGCRGNGGSNLFESVPNHNHNWPSMLHLHLSPTFSKTLFFCVCKRDFATVGGNVFPTGMVLSLLFSQDPSSLFCYCE
jgi:hypothetical protein